jgi:large subunit ribosomal protein L21
MYAIVEIAGKQFLAEKNKTLKVPLLQQAVGDSVEFDQVLMLHDGDNVKMGRPVVKGAKVEAKIVDHGREKKKIVFKKKRRKGYKVKNGHRQYFTRIRVENVTV